MNNYNDYSPCFPVAGTHDNLRMPGDSFPSFPFSGDTACACETAQMGG